MSNQDKVDIYEILDIFNEEVSYKGLDNTGKTTDDRDDVINRQTFNNWLTEYNKTHSGQIRSKKIDQRKNEWFKNDIEKLIQNKRVRKNLRLAYLRNTVPVFEGRGSIGYTSTQRVSKKYMKAKNELREQGNSEALGKSMETTINQLIDKVIEKHFTVFFENKQICVGNYINRNKVLMDFIDEKKIEEEAFKLIDNYYGIPEYDSQGCIIHVHNYEKSPRTDYFLKK